MKNMKPLIAAIVFAVVATGMTFAGAQTEGGAVDETRANRLIVVMDGGRVPDPTNWNPYSVGVRLDVGGHSGMMEYLFYFNLETGDVIPWLGESFEYNDDFTEVTVALRDGAEWGDGVPFTADDVVFTVNMLKANAPTLSYSAAMDEWVKEMQKIDDHTVKFILNKPNSRFVNSQLMVEIWGALPIVPKHVWENEDPLTFKAFDDTQDPKVVGTGPFKLTKATQEEIIYERRDDWWGAKTGFHALPEVKELVWIGGTEETRAALLASNDLDYPGYMTKGTFEVARAKNANVRAWSNDLPYAWMEPVPLTLPINTLIEPWDDPEMRWALNFALDRDEMAAIAWEGISAPLGSMFAPTAPLNKFLEDNKDLFEKYPVMEHNPEKTSQILTSKGYTKDRSGYWVGPDGDRLEITVEAAAEWPEQKKMGMVIAEQLVRAGFDAKARIMEWSTLSDKFATGESTTWAYWLVAGVSEPYPFLDYYHSKWVNPIGERQDENHSRWSNPDYDAVVDAMSALTADNPEYWSLARQALEIWMRELPMIPTTTQPALLPLNSTYWTNWPTAENNYIQPYYQCGTMLQIILELKKAQ